MSTIGHIATPTTPSNFAKNVRRYRNYKVIELAAFKEHRVILAFSDYLKSVGISNNIEVEPDRFALILHKQEDVERAEKELQFFYKTRKLHVIGKPHGKQAKSYKQKIDADSVGLKEMFAHLWARSGVYLICCAYLCGCLWLIS
jgi:GlpG protein